MLFPVLPTVDLACCVLVCLLCTVALFNEWHLTMDLFALILKKSVFLILVHKCAIWIYLFIFGSMKTIK